MKYFGPEVKLPLSESGIAPVIEHADISSAELVLGSVDLSGRNVVLFSADGELLRQPDDVILVGGHYLSGSEREFLKARNIRFFSLHSVVQEGIANVCDALMECARGWPSLHVCISLSVLELPGGLSVRELLYFLQRLRMLKNYSSANVIGDENVLTAKLLSELVKSPQPF
jgi:arginase family enzyme